MKIVGLIPARGGSKRIPKKNIRLLAGKPLIAYSIEAALKSKYINRVIVSTDDREISKISKKYGAEVIKRPSELAKDDSLTVDAIKHAIKILKKNKYFPDIIVLLQPTSPLRNTEDIEKSVELFLNNECKSVISVCEYKESPYWSLTIEENYAKPVFGWDYFFKRSQDLPKIYTLNGAIFITTVKNLFKYNGFFNDKIIIYIMPADRSIDIDEEIDFKFAELLLKKGK